MPRATFNTHIGRDRFYTRQEEYGYPGKKTVGQTDMWLLRYKPSKSVTTASRPLILTFLCYSQRQAGATAPARNHPRTCQYFISPRPHLLLRHPRPPRGRGGIPPAYLSPNSNKASQQRRTESLGCLESNYTRFDYLRSHFNLSTAVKAKCCLLVRLTFCKYLMN